MLTPVTGQNLAAGKLLAILFSWLILFVFSIPYIWAVASTGQNLWPAVVYLFITGTLLSLIFGELTIALSIRMKTFKGVLSIGLTISILSISPLILGASLRQNAIGRFIDMVNPFACALNTLDSVVIDSQGLAFQVPRLIIMLCYAIAIFGLLRIITRRVEL